MVTAEEIITALKNLAEVINRILVNFKKDGKERKTEAYLNKRKEVLEKFWKDYCVLHESLKNYADDSHPYFQENLCDKTKQIYETTMNLISNFEPYVPPPGKAGTSSNTGQLANAAGSTDETTTRLLQQYATLESSSWDTEELPTVQLNRKNYPKLPPINIPKFSGDYKDWKTFIDIFKSVIHNSPCLTNVEKMQYLLFHLEGDARRVISHLQLNSGNYETAISLIQARYNNNRKIITSYINTILDVKRTEYRSQTDIIALYDTIRECLEALKNLRCSTEEWGPIIVCLTMRKLDIESLRLFEESLSDPREMPTVKELLNFLEKRYQVLDCMKTSKLQTTSSNHKKASFHATVAVNCSLCNKSHNIYQCAIFNKMSVQERIETIEKKNLCSNCLRHPKGQECKSARLCIYCKRRHHSLLHQKNYKPYHAKEAQKLASENTQKSKETAVSLFTSHEKTACALLPTAIVKLKNTSGQERSFRALIDPGSQVSLITEGAAQMLNLRKTKVTASIIGVGEKQSAKASSMVSFKINLHLHQHDLPVSALVLTKINSFLPESNITMASKNHLKGLRLADPNFDKSGPIDVLLGADVYAKIIRNGLKRGNPTAQNTVLGWILFGNTPKQSEETNKIASFLSFAEIEKDLHKLWEIEEQTSPTQLEDECEKHFQATHTRDSQGRYTIRLPFKSETNQLGKSRNTAIARLMQVEKRLSAKPNQQEAYNDFLREYYSLGHMSPVTKHMGQDYHIYYLPHHAVFKDDSTTTKLRVVFDASCKTDSGLSLNDLLHTGPNIQNNLHDILLRWRKYRFVFTADIEKMFRQIRIAKQDRGFQRILWREKTNSPLQEFELNTLTYGMAPATYLSVRVLKQLACDEGKNYTLANSALQNDFYVDNMLTGTDTLCEAQILQKEVIELLSHGGFNLRKWASNDKRLLHELSEDLIETGVLEIQDKETIKTLGVHWSPYKDHLSFKANSIKCTSAPTKRELLSKVASIYDPLGWLAPVTISAKLIMQSATTLKTGWDQEVPKDTFYHWKKFEEELSAIERIRIPRWIFYRNGYELEIHGFCDASEKAFAAALYTRVRDDFGKIHTTLLTAKTKVAPLKQKVTIPRLELCAALLLIKLLMDTIKTLEIRPQKITAWSDSSVTLAWISKNACNLPTFMANRVTQIQALSSDVTWKYVPSKENPADLATRGISGSKLVSNSVWWRGPLWLSHEENSWPTQLPYMIEDRIEVKTATIMTEDNRSIIEELLTSSSFTKQIRIIAYCLRFINNSRATKAERTLKHLSTKEIKAATTTIIKMVQMEAFGEEIMTLKRNKALKSTSKMLALHPFLDEEGLLRVGGRLKNSNLPEEAKHQILLPSKHHFTNLVVNHAHQQTLHGGVQLTLNYIRTKYWLINAKSTVQKRLHRCITCIRHNAPTKQQVMGHLPSTRILPSSPFSSTGIDYAGPFLTKFSKGRGAKTLKSYIALFVCMITKAIHLELVSDLTSDAFLAAYKRFIARRGNCHEIYSDNGTNFVGANNKLQKDFLQTINHVTKQVAELLANDGTDWKFLPPASPQFGGLWEAGVKSVKGHLKKVMGETLLTFEEFTTVLSQVEACLNSRPLGQLSSDPRDLEPLTPGHFLIGRPLIAPPQPDVTDASANQRWKMLTNLHQHFWKRWSQEYLSSLQQRSKWRTVGSNPEVGELVLVKDDTLPPQKWALGRIVELHPGTDDIVRIVSVKYKDGIKKRPLNKLCQLPINQASTEDHTPKVADNLPANYKKKEKEIKPKRKKQPQEGGDVMCNNEDTTQQERGKKKIRIAPCMWATKMLNTILMLLYILTLARGQAFETSHPTSGIYIENIGVTQIKRGNLRLQITLPIAELQKDQELLNSTWLQITKACAQSNELAWLTHCDNLLRHLAIKREELLAKMSEITNHASSINRSKRGILGNILNSVFGVNDQVYTELEHIKHDQDKLAESTNHQAIFLNTKINQTAFMVDERMRHFDEKINHLEATLRDMAPWFAKTDRNRIAIEILASYLSAEEFYKELEQKYSSWTRAIHNQGHILDFITPTDVRIMVENVTERMPNIYISKMPQPNLDVQLTNEGISAYAYLHILGKQKYELMHITPIPYMCNNNSFIIADIGFSTLATNYDEQMYFTLERAELKECLQIESQKYFCAPQVIYSIEERPCCVIDQIYNRPSKLKCNTQHVKFNHTIWKALFTRNSWLYITPAPKVASIICGTARSELMLNSTGIIHLSSQCTLKTKETTLFTAMRQSLETTSSHFRHIEPDNITQTKLEEPPNMIATDSIIPAGKHILDYVKTTVPLTSTTSLYGVSTTTSAITSGLLIIVAFFTAFIVRHVIRKRRMFKLRQQAGSKTKEHVTSSHPATEISQDFEHVLSSISSQR